MVSAFDAIVFYAIHVSSSCVRYRMGLSQLDSIL